jgi:cyanophycinase-like exopeptidase
MTGRIGLHGGGEYVAGDEPFLQLLLDAAAVAPTRQAGRPVRIAIVPAAAARQNPAAAGRHGADAFARVASDAAIDARIEVAGVVDAETADDPDLARLIGSADLVHLPGGDPDRVPGLLRGTAAGHAIAAARRAGAVVAGASAGAMGLTDWTWTPDGVVPGLGLVRGIVVIPHFESIARERWQGVIDGLALPRAVVDRLAILGLDERTGVLSASDGRGPWRVAGPGRARRERVGGRVEAEARDGDELELPAELDGSS